MADRTWRIICKRCHDTFALYVGPTLPKPTDRVEVSHIRHIDGRPVDRTEVARCDSCDSEAAGGVTSPLDWVPVEEESASEHV